MEQNIRYLRLDWPCEAAARRKIYAPRTLTIVILVCKHHHTQFEMFFFSFKHIKPSLMAIDGRLKNVDSLNMKVTI